MERRKNIFGGDSHRALLANKVYEYLITREWISYKIILDDYNSAGKASDNIKLTSKENYGELKKAFSDVRKAISSEVGPEAIECRGNNRHKEFRYIGDKVDPLKEMHESTTIMGISNYYEFCQDSAGFFPESWLEYFLGNSMDMNLIKKRRAKGEQIIETSLDRRLTNLDLLPFLYESIKGHKVISIRYKQHFCNEVTLEFSPQFLKEYNGRWHLYGSAEGKVIDLALDRIVGKPEEMPDKTYQQAEPGYFHELYKDIVGFTHDARDKVIDVVVRAHSKYVFMLMDTKPIHNSQRIAKDYGIHEDGQEYGDFTFHIEVNTEFIARILQMGQDLEIISPDSVRKMIKEKIGKMADLYKG